MDVSVVFGVEDDPDAVFFVGFFGRAQRMEEFVLAGIAGGLDQRERQSVAVPFDQRIVHGLHGQRDKLRRRLKLFQKIVRLRSHALQKRVESRRD